VEKLTVKEEKEISSSGKLPIASKKVIRSVLADLATTYDVAVAQDLLQKIRERARAEGLQNIDDIKKMVVAYLKEKKAQHCLNTK
jgi:hypothetical protein